MTSGMLAQVAPELRAFARSLCRDPTLADDLVQETMLRAWRHRADFEPGTNFRAWTFTILRNAFVTHLRKGRHEAALCEAQTRETSVRPAQTDGLEMEECARALHMLPAAQRDALILVVASQFSYNEAARICGCAVGTVKSRVARARERLVAVLAGNTRLPTAQQAEPTADHLMAAFAQQSTTKSASVVRTAGNRDPVAFA
jgi:RNA polymerase sigma-70 factor (ECF subfamily)